MEQKQRRVKVNPTGEQGEEADVLPAPPPIDDLVKAVEQAAEEQRKAAEKAARKPSGDPRIQERAKLLWDAGYICHCGVEGCPIGHFVLKASLRR